MNDKEIDETDNQDEDATCIYDIDYVSIMAIISATILIVTNHNDGWGWLLLLAFLKA